MRRPRGIRKGLFSVLASAGLVVAMAAPIGAGAGGTVAIDPASGPAGSTITVSGTCVNLSHYVGVDVIQNDAVIASRAMAIAENSLAFSGEMLIPASAKPGEVIVHTLCDSDQGPGNEVVFTVTGSTPPPPPPPAPAATPESEPAPAPAAAPAAPVAAQPTFTG